MIYPYCQLDLCVFITYFMYFDSSKINRSASTVSTFVCKYEKALWTVAISNIRFRNER